MFGVTVQLMSDRELGRFEVLRDLDQRRLTTPAAAQLLGLERRQVFRLLKAYRAEGAAGLISKRRGGSSNRRKPEELRTKVLAIIRKRYWDFGPTLAAEKLREGHDITLGRETLRLWMIEARIWADRKQRRQQVHQPRHRRECIGELVQVDGCEHWWFEDRGPQCTLLGVHRRRDQPADASAICRERISRTSGLAPRSLSSASSSFAANPNGAARRHRAAAISATLVSSRSAERRYEPSGLMPAR